MDRIVVNADDYGMTESCTKAIAFAFCERLISSTTAMANGMYIEDAFKIARDYGFLDRIGIHINLTAGIPLTDEIKNDPFFCKDGVFHKCINRRQRLTNKQKREVVAEVKAQIQRLTEIGFEISHADSHHHIHTDYFILDAIKDCLFEAGINRIRLHRNLGRITIPKRIYKGVFNSRLRAMGFVTTSLMGGLSDVKESPRIIRTRLCEIMVHPDFDSKGQLINRERKDNNGFPVGNPLNELNYYLSDLKLLSYRDL